MGGWLESVPQSVFLNQDVDQDSWENNIQNHFHSPYLFFKNKKTEHVENRAALKGSPTAARLKRVWEFFENEQRLAEDATPSNV